MAKVRRFDSQDDCRRALANIYRAVEADQMDSSKARVLCYIALSISGVIKDCDIEGRIAELEKFLTSKESKRGIA